MTYRSFFSLATVRDNSTHSSVSFFEGLLVYLLLLNLGDCF